MLDEENKTELGQLRGRILYLPDDGENKTDVGQLRGTKLYMLAQRREQDRARRAQETANHVLRTHSHRSAS